MKKWPHIYYISQGTSPELHLSGIEKVCKAGCKLVQLRLKNTPENIVKNTAIKALSICKRHGAQLIINDHVTVVKNVKKLDYILVKTTYLFLKQERNAQQ